jgi:hypothetical protein
LSKDRLKRLRALEARRRPPAVVVDPTAAAASLRDLLAEIAIVRRGDACLVPHEPLPPAADLVVRQLDRIAAQFEAEANAAKQAKRQAKLERRRLRREQAAREGATEAGPAEAQNHGPLSTPRPPPAAAPLIAEEPPPKPVSMASLRY